MAWGFLGILALLVKAAFALGARGMATVRGGLGPLEGAALVLLTVAFVWGEGIQALQKKWVPLVARRLADLPRRGRAVHRILAPLYGMSLVGAPRGSLARAWAGVVAIVAAVLAVRAFPEPWRGIVDFAVAAALAWGSAALAVQAARALRGPDGRLPPAGPS